MPPVVSVSHPRGGLFRRIYYVSLGLFSSHTGAGGKGRGAGMRGMDEGGVGCGADGRASGEAMVAGGAPSSKPAPKPGRLVQYDLVRALAMTFVIIEHSLTIVNYGRKGDMYFSLCRSLFLTCNALFFLISGKFNLRASSTVNLSLFYAKKFATILIPTLLFFVFRTFCDLYPTYGAPAELAHVLLVNMLGGLSNSEYWFLFRLIGYLVVAPFLAHIAIGLSRGGKRLLLVMGIVWPAITLAARTADILLYWDFLFGGYILFFMVGPFVEELLEGWRTPVLVLVTALSCLVAAYLDIRGVTTDFIVETPFYVISGIGVFVVLARLGTHMGGAMSCAVGFVAAHFFTVYLVHIMVLVQISDRLPAVAGPASIALQWVLAAMTLVVSLATAAVVDGLIMNPLSKGFMRLYAGVKGGD